MELCAGQPDGDDMGRFFRAGLVVLVGALALAGCGVNGPLEPPPGAVAPTDKTTPTPAPNAAKPHDPFILDGILR